MVTLVSVTVPVGAEVMAEAPAVGFQPVAVQLRNRAVESHRTDDHLDARLDCQGDVIGHRHAAVEAVGAVLQRPGGVARDPGGVGDRCAAALGARL
jgi:hypothetical protein